MNGFFSSAETEKTNLLVYQKFKELFYNLNGASVIARLI